jgi:hypothetical protein
MATPEEDALRRSARDHRRALREALRELGDAAWAWADVGGVVRQSPAVWLAGALGVGLWLGGRRDGR